MNLKDITKIMIIYIITLPVDAMSTDTKTIMSIDTNSGKPLYKYFWTTKIEPPKCLTGFPTKPVLILILVSSRVGNIQHRAEIRKIVPIRVLKLYNTVRIFLLALPRNDSNITQKQVEEESNTYGDILQGSFIDNYRNLTHKHLMGLRWAATECTRAQFIVKHDDNIKIELSTVEHLYNTMLIDLYHAPRATLLMGFTNNSRYPGREEGSSYYVSWKEYPKFYFPPYLYGWFYITTPTVAARLCKEAVRHPYLYLDDVFVTGILAQALNIELKDISDTEHWFENYDYEYF